MKIAKVGILAKSATVGEQIQLGIRAGKAQNSNMSRYHLVRVGAMGQVGRFASVDALRYPATAE